MTELEQARVLGELGAKLEAIHSDVKDLKLAAIPDGRRRMRKVETHAERSVYAFSALLIGLAAMIGDRVYAFFPTLGG